MILYGALSMSVEKKLDALDLIINILIEHEKKLDNIVERLESNIKNIEYIIKKEKLYNINKIESTS
jgi:hypothetical protein